LVPLLDYLNRWPIAHLVHQFKALIHVSALFFTQLRLNSLRKRCLVNNGSSAGARACFIPFRVF